MNSIRSGGERIIAPTTQSERDAALDALQNAPLTSLFGGHWVTKFENAFADLFSFEEAIAVSSGTSALHAALVALNVGPGDEVIVTPFSFVASVSTVVQTGARPVFADIDGASLTLCPESVENAIGPRTKAILPVHINGNPADMFGLLEIAKKYGVAVVEDCAAAHGAKIGDRFVGAFGDIACFSFNIAKVMRTGEGGMAVTNSNALAGELRAIRVNGLQEGSRAPNGVERLGFNYTMAQPLAAIGVEQVRRFDETVAKRRENEELLLEVLDDTSLTFKGARSGSIRSPYATALLVPKSAAGAGRRHLVGLLKAEGVPVSSGCAEPLYNIDFLRPFRPVGGLPVAADASSRLVVFDPRPEYSKEDVSRWATTIRRLAHETFS